MSQSHLESRIKEIDGEIVRLRREIQNEQTKIDIIESALPLLRVAILMLVAYALFCFAAAAHYG